jgi:hypothetical protein
MWLWSGGGTEYVCGCCVDYNRNVMGVDSSKGEGSWRRIVQANELGDDELTNFPPAGKFWPEIEFIKALQATFREMLFCIEWLRRSYPEYDILTSYDMREKHKNERRDGHGNVTIGVVEHAVSVARTVANFLMGGP